jgi:hypothetical protein
VWWSSPESLVLVYYTLTSLVQGEDQKYKKTHKERKEKIKKKFVFTQKGGSSFG